MTKSEKKIKKALNEKGYELTNYEYDRSADDGWCIVIDFEPIDKTIKNKYLDRFIVETYVANAMLHIEKLQDLTKIDVINALKE